MKTLFAKGNEVKHDWYVIDASGKTLGRLAAAVAAIVCAAFNQAAFVLAALDLAAFCAAALGLAAFGFAAAVR